MSFSRDFLCRILSKWYTNNGTQESG